MTAQRRLQLLIGGLLITAAFIAYDHFTPSDEISVAAPVARRTPTETSTSVEEIQSAASPTLIRPLLSRTAYEADGLDAFANATQPKTETPVADAPPPAPVAPSLPFIVIGKKHQAGVWEVYLTIQDDIFIAKIGDVIQGTYKVITISPPNMQLTYLPLNETQNLDIGGALQ